MARMKDAYTATHIVPALEDIPGWEVTFPNGEVKLSTSGEYADTMRDTFDAIVRTVVLAVTPTLDLEVTR